MDRISFVPRHAVIRRRHTTDPTNALFTFQRSDDAEADPNTAIEVLYGSNLNGWTNKCMLVTTSSALSMTIVRTAT